MNAGAGGKKVENKNKTALVVMAAGGRFSHNSKAMRTTLEALTLKLGSPYQV